MTEPTLNPYASPVAEVADVAPQAPTAELNLFSARGRIGRLRYLAYSTGASIVYQLAVTALTAALAGTAGATAALVLCFVAVVGFSLITGIKRCHDLNLSGWWSLTLIIPFIAFVWCFMPGTRGENRFGPPPPPNTWGVRILGVLLPVVFFLGIVAAIALPAYQGYVNKARAAQAAGQR